MAVGRLWDVGVLGAVDDDVLGHDAALEHALRVNEVGLREFALMRDESRNLAAYLLGVLAAPPEKAGRLNAKVADLLGVAVDRAEAVLLLDLLVALLKTGSLDKTQFCGHQDSLGGHFRPQICGSKGLAAYTQFRPVSVEVGGGKLRPSVDSALEQNFPLPTSTLTRRNGV